MTAGRAALPGQPGPVIRVLIADDEALIRAGFRVLIESAADLRVVGEASNGIQAVRQARALRPESCSWTSRCRSWTASRQPG